MTKDSGRVSVPYLDLSQNSEKQLLYSRPLFFRTYLKKTHKVKGPGIRKFETGTQYCSHFNNEGVFPLHSLFTTPLSKTADFILFCCQSAVKIYPNTVLEKQNLVFFIENIFENRINGCKYPNHFS
jgi:hypothetical protein